MFFFFFFFFVNEGEYGLAGLPCKLMLKCRLRIESSTRLQDDVTDMIKINNIMKKWELDIHKFAITWWVRIPMYTVHVGHWAKVFFFHILADNQDNKVCDDFNMNFTSIILINSYKWCWVIKLGFCISMQQRTNLTKTCFNGKFGRCRCAHDRYIIMLYAILRRMETWLTSIYRAKF